MQAPGGQAFPVKVVEITDDDVVFDMNHEMAGKDLNFEITLEEICGLNRCFLARSQNE